MWNVAADHAGMVKKPKKTADIVDGEHDEDRLYLGEWLAALKIRPSQVARETGINEGYLSQLISRKKENPTRSILLKIAKAIRIEWHLLYEPPPAQMTIDQVRKYGSALLDRLQGPRR